MKGWERKFWEMLSPETAQLVKADIDNYTPPCPSRDTREASAAAAPLLPVAAAALTPGTRVRMQFGWPLLEQYLDGVFTSYRWERGIAENALVVFDGDDFATIVSADKLALAPPREDE